MPKQEIKQEDENTEPTTEDVINYLYSELERLKAEVSLLKTHGHDSQGRVMVPL